ncbi:epimerase, partial [Micrococcus luteus]
ARVLAEHSVDTVVHMDVTGIALGGGSRTTVKETNVIGTMQLLGACQKSPSVMFKGAVRCGGPPGCPGSPLGAVSRRRSPSFHCLWT